MASRCFLYQKEEETVNHLFIHYDYAANIWQEVIGKLGILLALGNDVH